ncbi:unnamed protein product, partial [Onchocerca ochengi]
EPICSLIGMNAYAGCRTYIMLTTAAQRFIRLWTMSDAEKSNNQFFAFRFEHSWDRLRHKQLLNGNSKFCCWTANITRSNSVILRYTPLSILLPVLFALFS